VTIFRVKVLLLAVCGESKQRFLPGKYELGQNVIDNIDLFLGELVCAISW
jgi:hypothetical protein